VRILFVFFFFLVVSAHASNDFYRCLVALNSGAITQEPAKLETEKFTFNSLVINIPPKAVRFAKYISADGTLTINDQVVLLLTLEEMFNAQNIAHADIPLEAALQRKLNMLLNIPESKKDDTYPREVTIITHQQSNMQDSTARLLTENASLQNAHTIVLGSNEFPIVSKDLIEKANTVQHSEGGEIDYVPPLATRFNLMGGYCNYCLTQSVGSIINAKLSESSLDPVNIYEDRRNKAGLSWYFDGGQLKAI